MTSFLLDYLQEVTFWGSKGQNAGKSSLGDKFQPLHLLYDPAIAFLGIYSKAMKPYIHLFTATLSIIAKNWEQTNCQSLTEWTNCGISV